jgi:hypothetical protein
MSNKEKQQSVGSSRDYLMDYVDRIEKSVGSNRDTDGLGIIAIGPSTIGSVDAINGEDGKEVPEFAVTRHELQQLASYWAGERIEQDFDWSLYQCTGSSEWRWSAYINRRLHRLAEVLGSETMRKVWHEAVVNFRKHVKLTDEDWRIFTGGTDKEQEAWRGRELARLDGSPSAAATKQTEEPDLDEGK